MRFSFFLAYLSSFNSGSAGHEYVATVHVRARVSRASSAAAYGL